MKDCALSNYVSLQALEVIRELQKHFPIKRSPMRLRVNVAEQKYSSFLEKLDAWSATILSKDESGSQLSVVSQIFGLVVLQYRLAT